MPIEIRELIIKTKITATDQGSSTVMNERQLTALKKELLKECKRTILETAKRTSHKR
jgi:hypothetical protein